MHINTLLGTPDLSGAFSIIDFPTTIRDKTSITGQITDLLKGIVAPSAISTGVRAWSKRPHNISSHAGHPEAKRRFIRDTFRMYESYWQSFLFPPKWEQTQ